MPRRIFFAFLLVFLAACTGTRPTRTPIPPTPTPAPTETPVRYIPPPPSPTPNVWNATITLWITWDAAQMAVLDEAMRSFQGAYPEVFFDVRLMPTQGLQERYTQETYNGGGPTILFAPAEWGPALADAKVVAELAPFATLEFFSTLTAPAAAAAVYKGQVIDLPYALRGVVLYRNQAIIPRAAATFDDLVTLSQAATHGGVVGADLERGVHYSAAHLYGLGGALMDENGNPAFNSDAGLQWLSLLKDFERAGPVELDTSRDERLFKENKAGWITEGTWNRLELANAIGPSNLAIDPWPSYGSGHLSGFVWADSLYLNFNAAGDEQAAALQFMGYLLSADIQTRLAEVGFIPSTLTARPRDELIQQALAAFAGGTIIPSHADTPVYWDPLAAALYSIFKENGDPAVALLQADDVITTRLMERRTNP